VFEAPEQKPPHFALGRLVVFGLAGGILGLVVAAHIFDVERFQNSNEVILGSFLGGAALAVLMAWRLIRPYSPGTGDRF
jgi:hypothetical protein